MLPQPKPGARITFDYEQKSGDLDLSFVKDADVIAAAADLTRNELGEGEGQYSPEQVKRALWEFFKHECHDLEDEVIVRFFEWTNTSLRRKWVGEPEIKTDP